MKPLHALFARPLTALLLGIISGSSALAQAPAASRPTTEEGLAALEAYVTNSDPGKALTGVPGPGHNAWMMTSAALVLFMTLPGLALFYGGLVRKKNGLARIVAHGGLYLEQLKAIGITLVLSIVATVILGTLVKALIGLRPSSEVETQGLDINEHGEEGYVL